MPGVSSAFLLLCLPLLHDRLDFSPASETVDLDRVGVGNVGTAAERLTTAAVQVFLDFRGLHGCWRLRYEQLEIEMMKDSKAEHKQHRSKLQIGKTCGCNCGKQEFSKGGRVNPAGTFPGWNHRWATDALFTSSFQQVA